MCAGSVSACTGSWEVLLFHLFFLYIYPRYCSVQTNQNQPNNNKCTLVTSVSHLLSPVVLKYQEGSRGSLHTKSGKTRSSYHTIMIHLL